MADFDRAETEHKPLAIGVHGHTMEDRDPSLRFYREVLNTPAVSARLALYVRVKIEVEGIDEVLRRRYSIHRSHAPQLIFFDYTADRIGSLSNRHRIPQIEETVRHCVERCEMMVAREARRAQRREEAETSEDSPGEESEDDKATSALHQR